MTETAIVSSEADLKSLIAERFPTEPQWMLTRRLKAAQDYFALDWPRLERTPLKLRKLEDIPVFQALPTMAVQDGLPAEGVVIRLSNNQVVSLTVAERWLQQGLVLEPLKEALTRPEVQEYLGSLIADDSDKIAALNGALWQNGVFLRVPPELDETVEVSVEHYADKNVRALLTRNLFVCGSHSRVVVTERLSTGPRDDKMLLSENTEIVIDEGGRLEYGAIQHCDPKVDGFIQRSGRVAQDGHLEWNIGEFGAGLIVASHNTHLAEPGASTRSTTVFFGSHQQHQDYTARSYHHAHHTVSDMVARGVMKHKARSIFTGLTQIDKGAHGSDGRQKEQTLMLSDDSRADAIPSLLIDEHDVFAAHAASAGPVDKAAVFYLTSRGLTEAEAVRLIVHGFLAPVIDTIPREQLRAEVWDAVGRKIRE